MSHNDTGNTLPPRFCSIFRSVLKTFDEKMYKTALKQTEQILKKFPNHGETLSMKGLILLYSTEQKAEASDFVKKGLRNDLRSALCWQALGLVHKYDRDFKECVRCYTQALRFEPQNVTVLRDLASMQLQLRHYDGLISTRRTLLALRNKGVREWSALALAYHLKQDFDLAILAIKECILISESEADITKYERSELILYAATLFFEFQKFLEVVDLITKNEKFITDEEGKLTLFGAAQLKLQNFDSANNVYGRLVSLNPENNLWLLLYLATNSRIKSFFVFEPEASRQSPFRLNETLLEHVCTNDDGCVLIRNSCMRNRKYGWLREGDENSELQYLIGNDFFCGALEDCEIKKFFFFENKLANFFESKRHTHRKSSLIGFSDKSYFGKKPSDCSDTLFVILKNLTNSQQQEASDVFESDVFPIVSKKSECAQTLLLSLLDGLFLSRKISVFLSSRIGKGVVSLYSAIKFIVRCDTAPVITEVLRGFEKSLRESSVFPPVCYENSEASPTQESPFSYLITLQLLAQHYDYIGAFDEALSTIDLAIEINPVYPELFLCKAKILKHQNRLDEASKAADSARMLDLADRYTNSKCWKYMFQANRIPEAISIASLFAKDFEEKDLFEMQSFRYELLLADAHYRLKEYGKALRVYKQILDQFLDLKIDEFDFHQFCVRKLAYRSYLEYIRSQDWLKNHIFYRKAAFHSVSIYIILADSKVGATEAISSKVLDDNALDGEPLASISLDNSQPDRPAPFSDDPDGLNLLAKNPLEAALEILNFMKSVCDGSPMLHYLMYKIAYRMENFDVLVDCIFKLWNLGGRVPTFRFFLFCFCHFSAIDGLQLIGMPGKDSSGAINMVNEILLKLFEALPKSEDFDKVPTISEQNSNQLRYVSQRLLDLYFLEKSGSSITSFNCRSQNCMKTYSVFNMLEKNNRFICMDSDLAGIYNNIYLHPAVV